MFRKFILKFWPIIFIFSLWILFSYPYFFQNKVPFASSYLVNFFSPWNAYPGFASPVKNNAMPDVISQIYPWKTFTIDSLKQGIIPLWNPYSFSGTPHLANYQSAVLSPFNLIFFILPFIDAWSLLVLLQPLLAGIFMYLYLRSLKITSSPSILGSVSFMFCGFITTWMGYATLGYAILFLPLALFLIEKFYQTKQFRYLSLLSLTLPLSFFSGHFQISLYFLGFVSLYLIYKLLETKDKRFAIYTLLFFSFGVLLTLPQVLPSIEAYSQSLRSTVFQKTEIIPWGYVSTFLVPDFLGNPVTRNDWFGHYAEWNAFVGTITLILGIYALFLIRSKKVIFFLATALISLLLCFQTPIIDLIVSLKIPVLSTSAASRAIVLFSFSLCVLAAFGFEYLLEDIKKRNVKRILSWLFVVLIIYGLLWAIVLFKQFMPLEKIVVARQNLILPTVMFMGLIGFILIYYFVLKTKKINKFVIFLPLILVFLVAFDMLRFSTKWQEFGLKNLVYPDVPVTSEFQKISSYDRVFGNIEGEATIYFRLPSIEGYDAVYNKRYGEFISSTQNGKVIEAARSVVSFPKYGLYSQDILNLLGVKYFVHKLADGRSAWVYPFWNYPNDFKLLYEDGAYQIFENKNAYPRAFLVNNYVVEQNPQRIINKMFFDNFNLRNNVVLEIDPKIKLNFKKSNLRIIDYSPNRVVVRASADGNSLLFLSDAYYPGWKAYIDGKLTQIYRADFAFRAIILPKGNHEVTFVYDPYSFKWGLYLAVIGIIFMVLTFIFRNKFILFPKI